MNASFPRWLQKTTSSSHQKWPTTAEVWGCTHGLKVKVIHEVPMVRKDCVVLSHASRHRVQKRSTENIFTSCVCLWSPDLIPWGPVVTTGNGNHNGQLDHSGSKVNTTDAQVMDSLNDKACLTVLPVLTTNTFKCNQCEVNTRHWGSIAEST